MHTEIITESIPPPPPPAAAAAAAVAVTAANPPEQQARSSSSSTPINTELDLQVAAASVASSELDRKWEEFQNLFQRMNEKMAQAIGAVASAYADPPKPALPSVPPRVGPLRIVTSSSKSAAASSSSSATPATSAIASATELIQRASNIVFVVGAGVSACRLPDFRSKNGFYAIVARDPELKDKLTKPEDFFTLDVLKTHTAAWFRLARQKLHVSREPLEPTDFHRFMGSLVKQGKCAGIITQNVDGLERCVGIPADKILNAHGSFLQPWVCLGGGHHVPASTVQKQQQHSPIPKCPECSAILRPQVTMFGEALPADFVGRKNEMLSRADLLIVAGTSLQVAPVSMVPSEVKEDVARILLTTGDVTDGQKRHFCFYDAEQHNTDEARSRVRDLLVNGDCQRAAVAFASKLSTTTTTTTRRSPSSRTPPRSASSRTPPRSPTRVSPARGGGGNSSKAAAAAQQPALQRAGSERRVPSSRNPGVRKQQPPTKLAFGGSPPSRGAPARK